MAAGVATAAAPVLDDDVDPVLDDDVDPVEAEAGDEV
jgi:hypothetical protein